VEPPQILLRGLARLLGLFNGPQLAPQAKAVGLQGLVDLGVKHS